MTEDNISARVGQILKDKRLTVACAESCTGGLLCSLLTDVAGSSAYVLGSMVTYTDEMKRKILNVQDETLRRCGAVSSETAAEMAEGVIAVTGASVGVSITGLAGPDGDGRNPVGTVYIAVGQTDNIDVVSYKFSGDRQVVKRRAATEALVMLRKFLTNL